MKHLKNIMSYALASLSFMQLPCFGGYLDRLKAIGSYYMTSRKEVTYPQAAIDPSINIREIINQDQSLARLNIKNPESLNKTLLGALETLKQHSEISYYFRSGYFFIDVISDEHNRDKKEFTNNNEIDVENFSAKDYLKNFVYGHHDDDSAFRREYAQNMVKNYKIHLMPTKEAIFYTLEKLISALHNNTELADSVKIIKIHALNDHLDHKGNLLPTIVVYPRAGKEHAQKVLNILYALFKDVEGLNKTPRFNRKITSLIYYAQGDSDYKIKALEGEDEEGANWLSSLEAELSALGEQEKTLQSSDACTNEASEGTEASDGSWFHITENHLENYSENLYETDMVHFKKDITGNVENYYLAIPNN